MALWATCGTWDRSSFASVRLPAPLRKRSKGVDFERMDLSVGGPGCDLQQLLRHHPAAIPLLRMGSLVGALVSSVARIPRPSGRDPTRKLRRRIARDGLHARVFKRRRTPQSMSGAPGRCMEILACLSEEGAQVDTLYGCKPLPKPGFANRCEASSVIVGHRPPPPPDPPASTAALHAEALPCASAGIVCRGDCRWPESHGAEVLGPGRPASTTGGFGQFVGDSAQFQALRVKLDAGSARLGAHSANVLSWPLRSEFNRFRAMLDAWTIGAAD